MKIAKVVFISLGMASPGLALADLSNQQRAQLETTMQSICGVFDDDGYKVNGEANIGAQISIPNILKSLLNVGIDADAKAVGEIYDGIAREDVPDQFNRIRSCNEAWYPVLSQELKATALAERFANGENVAKAAQTSTEPRCYPEKDRTGWAYLGEYSQGHWVRRNFDFSGTSNPKSLAGRNFSSGVLLNMREKKPNFTLNKLGDISGSIDPGAYVKFVDVRKSPYSGNTWALIQCLG